MPSSEPPRSLDEALTWHGRLLGRRRYSIPRLEDSRHPIGLAGHVPQGTPPKAPPSVPHYATRDETFRRPHAPAKGVKSPFQLGSMLRIPIPTVEWMRLRHSGISTQVRSGPAVGAS